MGVYYDPNLPAIVPDGFLSLGVERFVGEEGRLSYVLWEEDNIPLILVLEAVSRTYGGEYERKKVDYAQIGILYYVIYVPRRASRRRKKPLEVYRLVNGTYELQPDDRVWLPEIELASGRDRGTYLDRTREWLYWYDENGDRLPTPEERVEQERQRADKAEQALRQLQERLRQQGINFSEG
jgi:hypothetical protein